jgi:hypothetical protein
VIATLAHDLRGWVAPIGLDTARNWSWPRPCPAACRPCPAASPTPPDDTGCTCPPAGPGHHGSPWPGCPAPPTPPDHRHRWTAPLQTHRGPREPARTPASGSRPPDRLKPAAIPLDHVQVLPPRQMRPWRNKNPPRRSRARDRSASMSALARHKSRTASSATLGTRMGVSSPARYSRASRRQSRRSVSGLVARGLGDQPRRDHLTANLQRGEQAGQLIAGGAGLVAGSQPTAVGELRHEPAHRRLVIGDPVHGGRVLPRAQHRHRDRVPMHVQTEVGETTSSHTGHRPAPSVCGSVHASVDDPRDPRNGAGRSHADRGPYLAIGAPGSSRRLWLVSPLPGNGTCLPPATAWEGQRA